MIIIPKWRIIFFAIIPTLLVALGLGYKEGNLGQWNLLHSNIGISAMHMQLLHTNKVVIFDRTEIGVSNISLPNGKCIDDPTDPVLKHDCTAHSVLFDTATNQIRPLTVLTDLWCSSGAVLPNGTLVQTGGFRNGNRVVRVISPDPDDDSSCDWVEFPDRLLAARWYATNQILPTGEIIVMGGRRQFSYEFFPRRYARRFRFLRETHNRYENNLYPFLHLMPDGNLFVFANTRSVLLNYKTHQIVKEFPRIPGQDPRNYPSSGSSVLLPLDENILPLLVEILVCGGAPNNSYLEATKYNFIRALSSCGRINLTDPSPAWVMEEMPMARVMSDMLILPTGDLIIINGAGQGTAGWEYARDPVTRPLIYRPSAQPGQRFSVMAPSERPRMYHSSAILLLDSRVLIGGSNPHRYYNFTDVEYPTDLTLEAYLPPYLSDEYSSLRPKVIYSSEILNYYQSFNVTFTVEQYYSGNTSSVSVSVMLIAPSFSTHSFAMNQRMIVLKLQGVYNTGYNIYNVSLIGPSTAEVAPPGYYMLFVVHAGIPSSGLWVKIE
ncbi:hypothetical protein QQ045_022936 [Rhodiola kirilowii]